MMRMTRKEAVPVKTKRIILKIRISGYLTYFSKVAQLLCKLSIHSSFSYLFLPIVFPEILVYILVMLLNAIDFWVVKNIVGRKLIKMRWWFIIDNEGNERWWYESKEDAL